MDDDLDERLLTARAFAKCLVGRSTVNVVDSGESAIRYMIGEGEYADRNAHPFPTLIVTDLNMAGGDGFDVLEFIQANPEWSVVPRIVLSSSDDADDVRTAFYLGASAYHVKPASNQKLVALFESLLGYWVSSEVPPVDTDGRIVVTNCKGRRGARYPQLKGGVSMTRVEARAKS